MATFKNGDKVKIPTIGTAYIKTSAAEIRKALFDYKLDYLYVCQVWEKDGEIGLMRGDGKVFEQDLYHERDLEHYEEYNETFNPEAHSHLIIDFDKVEIKQSELENIWEEGKQYYNKYYNINKTGDPHSLSIENAFEVGAKSNASRNYWFKRFNEEQKGQNKQEKS